MKKIIDKVRNINRPLVIGLIGLIPVGLEVYGIIDSIKKDKSGKYIFTTYNKVSIFLFIVYIIAMIYLLFKENEENKSVKELEDEKKVLKDMLHARDQLISNMKHFLARSIQCVPTETEFTKDKEYDKCKENVLKTATEICYILHNTLTKVFGKDNFTINLYQKCKIDNKNHIYFMRHEGAITQPKKIGSTKLLKKNPNNFYRERILLNNNPSYVIHLDSNDVANEFGINVDECKYKQYIGIPICAADSDDIKFLLEINVIDESILEDDVDKVMEIINTYIKPITDCFSLMTGILNYVDNVDEFYRRRETHE